LKLLTSFANEFVSSIDGTSHTISTKELSGGARIYFIFNSVFGHALDSIHPCANITNEDIRTAIRNSTGPRCSLFVPEAAFDLLVRPQIRLLEAPSLRCVDLAFEELSKICHTSGSKEITRFPKLHVKLVDVVSDLLQERLMPTSDYVESLISVECAYINANHPDFPGAAGALTELERKQKENDKLNRKKFVRQQMNSPQRTQRSLSVSSNASSITQQSQQPKESLLNYFLNGKDPAKPTIIEKSTFSLNEGDDDIDSLSAQVNTKVTRESNRN
jgi:dynamin 1-like protein